MSRKKAELKRHPKVDAEAKLHDAISAYVRAHGEAKWTNGYRAQLEFGSRSNRDNPEIERMYQQESAQWKEVDLRFARMWKLIRRTLSRRHGDRNG